MSRETDDAPVDAEGSLTIGQVAERLGLEQSAIRYYERIGLLPAPEREGGWRRYDSRTVRLLNAIVFAKQAGFSLEEIRTLLHAFPAETPPPERWRELASRKLEEIEQLIERAQTMRQLLREGLDCDCTLRNCRGLEDCELEPTGSGAPLPLVDHGRRPDRPRCSRSDRVHQW